MAIELIRAIWCDVHMQQDEMVPGKTLTIALNGTKPIVIELCDVHEKEFLEPLATLLASHGRTEEGKTLSKKQRRATQDGDDAVVTPKGRPGNVVKCPVKPCPEKFQGPRQYMRRHLEQAHATTLAVEETKLGKTLDGEPLTAFCDLKNDDGSDCGLGFVRSQSLGVHKTRAHGVAGPDSRPPKKKAKA